MKFYIKSKLSENISKTPEGYLLCRNVMLTHTGKLVYLKGEHPFEDINGELTVTRTPEELFSDTTISSFTGKSITIQHPNDFVDTDNWQELTNGVLVNVRKGSEQIEIDGEMVDVLLGDFLITTKEAIQEVENGLREVSLGYDSLWVQTGDNEAVHTKIVGNHCALVEGGRAGIQCAIKDKKGDMSMKTELQNKFKKFFGKTVDEAVAEKEKEEADKKAKDASKEEIEKKLAEAKAEVAELEAQAKALEESEAADEDDSEKEESKDEEGGEEAKPEGKLEERVANLEKGMEKILSILEKKEEGADEDGEESEEVIADEEAEDGDSEKEGVEGKAGDTMARAEILAPGIANTKDVKKKALEAAFKTADGKKVIAPFLGGKKLSEVKDVDMLFMAASEALKVSRGDTLVSTRALTVDSFPSLKRDAGMTPEQINEANAKHYNQK